MALTKKSLNNFLPNGFETQNKEGYKANFTNDRILSGYEKDTLEILSGPNLNNFIDKTGKNFNTLNDLLEYFNEMPIDSFPIVNASNQLDYKSINSFFRNVGELVFSSVPIDDKNLHLADGSLLDGKGTYRVFVDFIGKMATKYPNLFTDEATWQATVSKYGTCGKYVWNAENKTLRLPRLKGIVEATIDQNSIGNITEAGLPNITGTAQFSQEWETWGRYDYTGAFYLQKRGGNGVDGGHGNFDIVGFDASRSSQVYGKSNTVQPQTVKQYIYIVVSVDTEETTKLTSVFQYRGSVPTFEDLPTEGNITGDVWNVDETDVNYVWDGAEWDQLSGSVDLTGYYTKEECNTRFATVTSLESNVENLQSKITQNTTDIASLGLGGLVASSLEKGKALKYLETKGNITEDADVYNDVYNYKHSSFNLSKFTVVGTPTITEDGVLIQDGTNNRDNNIKINQEIFENAQTFTLKLPIKINSSPQGTVWFYNNSGFQINIISGGAITGFLRSGTSDTYWDILNNIIIADTSAMTSINNDLIVVISFDGTKYKLGYIADNKYTESYVCENSLKLDNSSLDITVGNNSTAIPLCDTEIDLKKLSITVDGKEVFNGNKTGFDVIKEDNYTVAGSPVITEDGVASGFSGSDYLTVNTTGFFNNNYNFEIDSKVKYTSDTTAQELWDFSWVFRCKISMENNKHKLDFFMPYGTAYTNTFAYLEDYGFVDGDDLYIKCISENAASRKLMFSKDGINWNTITNTNTTEIDISNHNLLKIGQYNSSTYWLTNIDLNSFKIYVDGELVYQPCLKIPYNISKTGLKVVNADARERVIGMGKDYGYSQYFTIDEENKNATLPIGAGITGRQDLVTSFDDGTNKYEQFSDLTFKQSGTCTANTAVTFIQPYKDDTYKLSVPYSAKTKTGFTPTVSGDWFAEGKIYLD